MPVKKASLVIAAALGVAAIAARGANADHAAYLLAYDHCIPARAEIKPEPSDKLKASLWLVSDHPVEESWRYDETALEVSQHCGRGC